MTSGKVALITTTEDNLRRFNKVMSIESEITNQTTASAPTYLKVATREQWTEAGEFTGIVGSQRYTGGHRGFNAPGTVSRGTPVWENPEAPLSAYSVGDRVYVKAQGAWRKGIVVKTARTRVTTLYRNLDRGTVYEKATTVKWVRPACVDYGLTIEQQRTFL